MLAAKQSLVSRLRTDQIAAKAAKNSSARRSKNFLPTKTILLPAIISSVRSMMKVAAATGKSDKLCAASPHDRLFDVMMTRFDILQNRIAMPFSISLHGGRNVIPSLARAIWCQRSNQFDAKDAGARRNFAKQKRREGISRGHRRLTQRLCRGPLHMGAGRDERHVENHGGSGSSPAARRNAGRHLISRVLGLCNCRILSAYVSCAAQKIS